ncbi:hypothetical protein MMC06_004025 [Schaereria dolodes]|nr:hypothetical protein [Schaereria dolodes]
MSSNASADTSTDHTPHTGLKPSDAYNVITDPNVLPTLDEAPKTRQLQSHFVLLALLSGAIGVAWLLGLDIIQGRIALLGLGIAVTLAIGAVGGWNIDWWELVLGYWWFSIPIAGAAGLGFLMMQEHASGMDETD